jgi:hypothetical protein
MIPSIRVTLDDWVARSELNPQTSTRPRWPTTRTPLIGRAVSWSVRRPAATSRGGNSRPLMRTNIRSNSPGRKVTRVIDNPLHAGHRPPERQRRRGELLWTVRRDHVTWTCELRFHGESVGWEAQILRENELVIGRTFILRELAVKWAETERREPQMG